MADFLLRALLQKCVGPDVEEREAAIQKALKYVEDNDLAGRDPKQLLRDAGGDSRKGDEETSKLYQAAINVSEAYKEKNSPEESDKPPVESNRDKLRRMAKEQEEVDKARLREGSPEEDYEAELLREKERQRLWDEEEDRRWGGGKALWLHKVKSLRMKYSRK